MQLRMATPGRVYKVVRLLGHEKQQQQLCNLGLVPGTEVEVVASLNQNLILLVKQSRLGISAELAQKILVEELSAEMAPSMVDAKLAERRYS